MTDVPDDPEPEIYVPHWPDMKPKKPKFWTATDVAQNEASQKAYDEWVERQNNPPPEPVLEPTDPADPAAESAMPLAEIPAPEPAAPEPAAPEPAA